MLEQILWLALTVVYCILIVGLTKWTYGVMLRRGFKENVAVYYNRKIIHMAAGGVVALLTPYLFDSPGYPLAIGIILTLFTIIPHLTHKRMEFMQTKDNRNEVKFAMMGGTSIAILWIAFNNPFIAIIPALFMSFGDAITGVVRNALFQKRTKNPIGNVFMLIVCVPVGYFYASMASVPIPLWGVLAAVAASAIERYEFGPLDDNVLITVTAMIILLVGSLIGPLI